jgi:cell division protein FtsB
MLARYKEDLDGTIGHLILKWVPVIVVGVMVPFVGWLWHDREAVLARTVDLQLQIAQHAGAIANLVDVNVSQDKLHQAEIKALTDRLDIHRREIDQLHQQIIDHIVSDQRRLRNRE